MIEKEGQQAVYIYLVLKGAIELYHRPEKLYDPATGKQFKIFNQLHCVVDPMLAGQENLGVLVGSVRGETLLCEDAALFNVGLSYSCKAGHEGALVYRITKKQALDTWPIECQNDIKLKILAKYKWYYERLLQIESAIADKPYRGGDIEVLPPDVSYHNARTMEAAKKVEIHTKQIYPTAGDVLKN